jgi:hypothetical protein
MRERDSKDLAGYSSLAGGDLPQHVGLERGGVDGCSILDEANDLYVCVRILAAYPLRAFFWVCGTSSFRERFWKNVTPRNRICALFEI